MHFSRNSNNWKDIDVKHNFVNDSSFSILDKEMEQTRIDNSDSATQEYFEKFVLEFIKPTILGRIFGTK